MKTVFVHIFKCAGTALTAPVLFHYKDEEIKPYYNFNTLPGHPKHWDNLPEEHKEKIWYFSGHLSDHNTWESLQKMVGRDVHYITILRHPVERVISTYYYLKHEKCKNGPLYKMLNMYSLEECLDIWALDRHYLEKKGVSEHARRVWVQQLMNHQTRILSDLNYCYKTKIKGYFKVPDRHDLLDAEFRLKLFSEVTIQEDLYEDWDRFKPYLRDIEIPDPPVDFIQITKKCGGEDGLEDYFSNECKPFYRRRFWS